MRARLAAVRLLLRLVSTFEAEITRNSWVDTIDSRENADETWFRRLFPGRKIFHDAQRNESIAARDYESEMRVLSKTRTICEASFPLRPRVLHRRY